MSRGRAVVLLAGILMAGCMGNPPIELSDKTSRGVAVGWIRDEWQTCTESETCPKPTPKTIALPAPVPAPASMPTPAPQTQLTGQAPENPERVRLVVHFEFAKATPTKAGLGELRKMLSRIREGDAIRIEGHTDDIGTDVFNDRLARKRAEFVAAWLKRHGVTNPMEVEAKGKCCYVAANDSDDGRAANRRAVVILKAARGDPETTSTTQKENVR